MQLGRHEDMQTERHEERQTVSYVWAHLNDILNDNKW